MPTPTALPGSFTAGDVLTAANMNLLRGAFRVLQVVTATTNSQINNATTTFVDTTLTVTITPSLSSSKILVLGFQAGCGKDSADIRGELELARGATLIHKFETFYGHTSNSDVNFVGSCGFVFLDSPATTSATTYKTQFKSSAAAGNLYVQVAGAVSSIAALEISA